MMVLAKFRQRYPQGSIVSELIDIDRGTYIVRVSIAVDEVVLSTGLAGANTVELAEDMARERAIAPLILSNHNTTNQSLHHSPSVAQTKSKPLDKLGSSITDHQATKLENKIINGSSTIKNSTSFSAVKEEMLSDSQVSEIVESQKPPSSQPVLQEPKAETKVAPASLIEPLEELPQPAEPTIDNSPNLFAGTSNPQTIVQDKVEENNHVASENSANNSPAEVGALEEVNFNEIKHQTDLEIKRLGWTKEDGREFLKSRYGKRSRLQLTDSQLLEFLEYLASQPNPS